MHIKVLIINNQNKNLNTLTYLDPDLCLTAMMSTDEMAGLLTGPIPAQVAGANVGSSGGL